MLKLDGFLKIIVSGFSMNSVDDVCDTFQKIFPEIDIATTMKLGRTKATYIANFGILPYVLMLFHDSINKLPVYTLSFDESLNKVTQKCDMDLKIGFWDDNNIVKVRYLRSSFFGDSTAKDLMTQFEEVTNKLVPEKLYQISIDGPKVNLNFYREVEAKRNESFYQSLIDVATCSLHSVQSAVKSGFESTSWGIKDILKDGFNLLYDSPARREHFQVVTKCNVYQLKDGFKLLDDSPACRKHFQVVTK